ncbi:hypothetical protein [Variovorax ginsengisoli]|uniref:DUF4123 domain-containing protein n=1 Tax=Variovorax ginsengisoli TaxID=363844 RepID=A0ABT9SC04_9BURK|nr:hypothetical protein [Variovorax ginsengisoli]MDP9901883.1 hypothetical protein [Variovorax ginsengisoli]
MLDALTERLTEQIGGGAVYLLIDPSPDEPPGVQLDPEIAAEYVSGPQKARMAAWERRIESLHSADDFPRTITELEFPYLVRLENTSDPWFATSIEWAVQEHLNAVATGKGPYRIGGWLRMHDTDDSDQPLTGRMPSGFERYGAQMSRQLSKLLHLNKAGQARVARLFDRRVLNTLRQGASLDWPAAVQGMDWHYLDHNFALQTLQGQPGELNENHKLGWNETHLALISRCQPVSVAQTLLLRSSFPLPDDTLTRVLDKVKAAEKLGLVYPEDRGAYAAEALLEPAFETCPQAQQLIKAVVRLREDLGEVIEIYRDEWVGKPADHWAAHAAPTTQGKA